MSTPSIVRIGGAQGFYGDSPMGAVAMVMENAVDYLMHDALAELTLAILQKDRQKDPSMGYARDIEFNAKFLYPAALGQGIKVVTNSGGLNPVSAANKLAAILKQQGLTPKIAAITGDDLLDAIPSILADGEPLLSMDTGQPYAEQKLTPANANVYIGAKAVKEALAQGADIILAGRVADPALCVGILAYEYNWDLDDPACLDKLANGVMVGHILECGGQASGGNSYAEWPQNYRMSDLGYPIAHVRPDGSATITRLLSQGGKVSRDTVREQLVYEIHDPSNYITPDVIVDLTQITVTETAPDMVEVSGAIGKPRPEKLKLAISLVDGFVTEQIFFFSWPYAYDKATKFEQACREIWERLPFSLERIRFDYIGLNGIHGEAAPRPSDEWISQMPEIGLRIVLRHKDHGTGKMAMQSIVCLGLNGPPGIVANPSWGRDGRTVLRLWPTLISRQYINEKIEIIQSV